MARGIARAIFGGAVGRGERLIEDAVAATLRGAAARQQAGSGYEQQRESQNHFHPSPALR
jgi:hypothetical protein